MKGLKTKKTFFGKTDTTTHFFWCNDSSDVLGDFCSGGSGNTCAQTSPPTLFRRHLVMLR